MRSAGREREKQNRIELQKIYHNSKQKEEASITRDTLRLKKRVEKNDEILPKHTVVFDDDYNRKKRVLTHEPNTINHTDKRRTFLIRTLVSICLFVQF